MLQQVMTKPGEIIFREVPIPEIRENQVLVKIMNIGICGSDIHVYHGKHPFTKYPVTQGHEVSGVIEKVGNAVTEFHAGEKVTIEPQVFCGKMLSVPSWKIQSLRRIESNGIPDNRNSIRIILQLMHQK